MNTRIANAIHTVEAIMDESVDAEIQITLTNFTQEQVEAVAKEYGVKLYTPSAAMPWYWCAISVKGSRNLVSVRTATMEGGYVWKTL